jgi:hypothetical protein
MILLKRMSATVSASLSRVRMAVNSTQKTVIDNQKDFKKIS